MINKLIHAFKNITDLPFLDKRKNPYGLSKSTSIILEHAAKLTHQADEYNNYKLVDIPSTYEDGCTRCYLTYSPQYVNTTRRYKEFDKRYIKHLGVVPTKRRLPSKVLLPQASTLKYRDNALLNFDTLPELDKLYLLNLNIWANIGVSMHPGIATMPTSINRMYPAIPDFSATGTPNIKPGSPNSHLVFAPENTQKYIINYPRYPTNAGVTAVNYPSSANILDIESEHGLHGVLDFRIKQYSGKEVLNNYTSILGAINSIDAGSYEYEGRLEDTPEGSSRHVVTGINRAICNAQSTPKHKQYSDSLPSSDMVTPVYDYTLGAKHPVDLSKLYSYLSTVEYLMASSQRLVNDLYIATLPEARKSNGQAATIIDFWGKHNLYDTKASRLLHNIKKDAKIGLYTTLWYNICTLINDIQDDLVRSGITYGLGSLLSDNGIRDVLLFLIRSHECRIDDFLSTVDSYNGKQVTSTIPIVTVDDTQTTVGMNNSIHRRYGFMLGVNQEPISTTVITNKISPLNFKPEGKTNTRFRTFTTTEGIEGLARDIIVQNKLFKSSMLLKLHDSPFLKSLHTSYMRKLKRLEAKNIIPQLTDKSVVMPIITDITELYEFPDAARETRDYLDADGIKSRLRNSVPPIPEEFDHIFSPLFYPTIEGDRLAIPNESSPILGILTPKDIFANYTLFNYALPNLWPPEEYSTLPIYPLGNSDNNTYIYDASDIIRNINFIFSYKCKPGKYGVTASPAGALHEIPDQFIVRDIQFANIADLRSTPNTPIRYQIDYIDSMSNAYILNTPDPGDPSSRSLNKVWRDHGINGLSTITYPRSIFIPPHLGYEGADFFNVREAYASMDLKLDICNEIESHTTASYTSNPTGNSLGIIFGIDLISNKSTTSVNIKDIHDTLRYLPTISSILHIMETVLTDYLDWRSEHFPDDLRFIRRATILRNMCNRLSDIENINNITKDIISQTLNTNDLKVLREV